MIRNLLTQQESAQFTLKYQVVLTADDLTVTATATLQTISLIPLLANDIVRYVAYYLKTPFQDDDDAAFNSDTMSLGDTSSVTTFMTAKELNANGTFITVGQGPPSIIAPYTAADNVNATVNSMTAKALNNLNVGEIEIYIDIFRPSVLSLARSAVPITTKS